MAYKLLALINFDGYIISELYDDTDEKDCEW